MSFKLCKEQLPPSIKFNYLNKIINPNVEAQMSNESAESLKFKIKQIKKNPDCFDIAVNLYSI